MTTTEIAAEHGVTRQTVHAHRKRGVFPKPVEGEGSTRPRFRADEVAAFFAANPPTPGKRTDLADQQQGEAMATPTPTTVDPRLALMSALNTPPYDGAAGKIGMPLGEAARLIADYRAAVLAEGADAVFALDYDVMVGEEGDENLGSMREAWDLGTVHANQLLRRMANEQQQP
ncbi:helix-turn-helix domain-containing protein [Streptomyces sp. LBUM 1479]|uniref:helix-turn-helix transcriptional regulator n=1 Tax=Streptomyces scabiei TaxID=1930 RepID=UPI001B32A007|nr:helix-turn-helix domain-containing protein [Streptomyces scabiei]MBP5931844.1 helix-turn-helix domain-containing protein [Streptomyces sp. LBUM 1479]MDX3034175.1 helix-turn-helix domain-containing protein [Streptomyces scabiei]